MGSIDVSDIVIKQMKDKNKGRPDLVFQKMDAMNMDYDNERYNVVLDKGTLDALFTDDSSDVVKNISMMFSEIGRVLKLGGRYICVSLLQPHIVKHVTEWFTNLGWPIRVIRCTEADQGKDLKDRIFPVFVIICTKFKKMENMKSVIELALSSDTKLSRLDKGSSLIESVRGCQQFAALRAAIAGGGDKSMEEVCLQLRSEDSNSVKYSLFLAERNGTSTLPFAAFIVPQGREVEWMFATAEGRRQLCDSASCARLIVVHLGRDASFTSLDQVQSELSSHVLDFSPQNLPAGFKVPFLSAGSDEVGSRKERCRGHSQISGDYVVEDVTVGNSCYRRLVFLNRPNLTQTEAVVVSRKDKNKKIKKAVDLNQLISTYHTLMIGGLGLYLSKPSRVCVVGLGGGALPAFIHKGFPLCNIDVIELDSAMLDIATQQFQLTTDTRLVVKIQDGLQFFKDAEEKYDIIMLDVDSKDVSCGMSCPPKQFVQPETLQQISKCLQANGLFILNLVCRDSSLRSDLMTTLSSVWSCVASSKLDQEVNEVIFATSDPSLQGPKLKKNLSSGFKLVNDHVKKAVKIKQDLIDLETDLKTMHIDKS